MFKIIESDLLDIYGKPYLSRVFIENENFWYKSFITNGVNKLLV